jgi:PAS domain S-box-containing protein
LVIALPEQRSTLSRWTRRARSLVAARSDTVILEEQRNALAQGLEAVKLAGDELQTLLDRQPGMVVIHARDEIVFVNHTLLRSLGWRDATELVGRRVEAIADPRSTELFEASTELDARQGWLRRRDGSDVLVEATAAQDVVYRGVPSLLTVATDITERERLRQQLAAADRLTTLALLAAGVAHEVNNPLGYVLNNVEMARRGLEPLGDAATESREALGVALEGVDRIRTIVRDLLLLARADVAMVGPTEIGPIVESTLALARVEIDRAARLEIELGATPVVRASAARLAQIVLNLVLNALEAMKDRDPATNVLSVRTGETPDGHAFLEVADNGCGIDPTDERRIFEPFFTTKPAGQGTGLGLAITQRLVVELGGEISFKTTPDVGTTFTVRLRPAGS